MREEISTNFKRIFKSVLSLTTVLQFFPIQINFYMINYHLWFQFRKCKRSQSHWVLFQDYLRWKRILYNFPRVLLILVFRREISDTSYNKWATIFFSHFLLSFSLTYNRFQIEKKNCQIFLFLDLFVCLFKRNKILEVKSFQEISFFFSFLFFFSEKFILIHSLNIYTIL